MYIPAHFAEQDLPTLHGFIERHSFGLLVSQVEAAPFATHLPFLLDRAAGPNGTLLGHVAKANPHWRTLAGQKALAIFSGPHAYISPTWYESENVVPTWNYAAVHATGPVELVEDRDALFAIVERLTAVYESSMPRQWMITGAATFIDRMLEQIVGFRLAIESLEGKWKLNQNQPLERRVKVERALREQGGENAVGIADLMRADLPGEG